MFCYIIERLILKYKKPTWCELITWQFSLIHDLFLFVLKSWNYWSFSTWQFLFIDPKINLKKIDLKLSYDPDGAEYKRHAITSFKVLLMFIKLQGRW